ncbi:MAG: hypothetical protein IIT58_07715 [Treponema sp.]|nr:hypothetical protein [Treponema sp.]
MKKIITFICLAFCTFFISAQNNFFENYVYQSWSAFGGLTGTTANDIVQTSDGFINIGTYEGLVKFDGVEFKAVNRSLDKDYDFLSVRTMLEDSKGTLWLGSNDEGLQKIGKQDIKMYTMNNGLPNNSIRSIIEDKKGNIWVGTAGGIIYITPEGRIISPQFAAGTTANGVIVQKLFCDSAGRIWVCTTNEGGFFLYNNGVFYPVSGLEKFNTYFVTAIMQDFQGKFWLGLGDNGIVTMQNGFITKVVTNTFLDHVPSYTILQEKNGTIWFGTEKGLVVYNNGSFYEYHGVPELAKSNINKIIQDREGNIWFATDRNGIGKMTLGKFKIKRLGRTVNSIAEDANGVVWAGTDAGVLCYINENPVSNTLTEYTKSLRIRHIEITSDSKVLVSCYSNPGQLLYDGKTIKKWNTDNGLCGNKVRVAIENKPGEYYVGTTTGLSIIHADGTIKNFNQNNGLDTEYIMALYKDTHDVIWVGTDGGGIYLIKDEEIFTKIDTQDGISGNVIFKITQDAEGFYWICTGSGITRCHNFDPSKEIDLVCETLNSENGLGTNSVFQILFDKGENAWITNNHGIASINKNELQDVLYKKQKTVSAKYYNKNDGLDSEGTTSTALSIVDHHGRLWFTMIDGIAIYDPLNVSNSSIPPLVQIETISIDNEEIKNYGQNIILKPGTKRIDIKYTGISFEAPERIKFSHVLTNFEKDFSAPNPGRIVSYTNLTPGKHSFIVNAISESGLKSDNEEMMIFFQKPYPWQRPIFWIILVVVFIGTVIIYFYIREQRIKKENMRLESLVQERTRDLALEKEKSDKLLRSILPDKIADRLKESDKKSFGESFDNATLLFSDIVGFTKVSSGQSAEEIVRALNNLFTLFDERAKKMGVEKIKTIGDSYMAACGIPEENPDHARIMIEFAKGMYEDLNNYNKTAKIKFNIRVGLNCGPVIAGVIGTAKFIYDVWGDTVNVASRMETAATPGTIRITEDLKNQISGSGIQVSSPIECEIKGKGLMKTYEVLMQEEI